MPLRRVGGEGEHRLEERLELKRRSHFADESDRVRAGVPEAMRRSSLDDGGLPGSERHLLAPDLEA
jgi:hypothetical protein